jgi:hypothetical protein
MSHVAIAAALALEDVSAGERLTAFSLASFANREHRAFPGTRVAAARAGLSRSQYLAASDGLQKRGLLAVEESGGGRGRSAVVAVLFAEAGPWFEGEINAALFEATLGYSAARGSARLLLATLAAVADEQREVAGVGTDEIRAAAGMADSTYRRARAALLASGELVLETAGGGRAKTNRWRLRDPQATGLPPVLARRTRRAPRGINRPLMAAAKEPPAISGSEETAREATRREGVKGPGLTGVSERNPGQTRTVCAGNGLGLSGVSRPNPGQSRTVSPETPPQTPPETPPQTPPRNARAGREPQNPRTLEDPPSPPDGGSWAGSVRIVEDYLTDRGRRRQRTVTVELDAIRAEFAEPTTVERSDWGRIRSELRRTAGESTFEIWLAQLELLATDQTGCLLLAYPLETRAWLTTRYGGLIERTGRSVGRELRLATDRELQLLSALAAARSGLPESSLPDLMSHEHKEAV